MKTIDKAQERKEMQAAPEFKKKEKIKKLLYAAGVVIFCIAAFLYYRSPSTIGVPHMVKIDSMNIEPGKTTVQDLADQGFEISDTKSRLAGSVYDISGPVEGKSYYDILTLEKNGKIYASLAVVNEKSGKTTLANCKVREVIVRDYHEDRENTTIDGAKIEQLTVDFLKQDNGEPYNTYSYESEGVNLTKVMWEKGRYSISIITKDDGTVKEVMSKYEL